MADQTSIEQIIRDKCTRDAQKTALDFAAFCRANGIILTPNEDGNGWAVGGIVGNSLGYWFLNGAEEFPGPWTLWFNSCDFDSPADDELKEAAWAHAAPCGHCHAGWKDCGGGNRTIFGKEFEWLCHSPLMFANPDVPTLEKAEKLLLLIH